LKRKYALVSYRPLHINRQALARLFSPECPSPIIRFSIAPWFPFTHGLTLQVMIVNSYRKPESQRSSPALGFPRPRFLRYRRLR